MKRYTIEYLRPARKDLQRLPSALQDRIMAAIEILTEDPRPHGCKKLQGSKDAYRIRIGNYRVIYEIHEQTVVVLIVRISDRKDAYR